MAGSGKIEALLAARANRTVANRNRPASQSVRSAQALDIKKGLLPTELRAFKAGSQGQFPYYWQNPTNLKFNIRTYHWISASLRANCDPIELSQPFTNLYISALSKVNYYLSSSDQIQLNHAQQNIILQQGAMLKAWQAAFGKIPVKGEFEPIDIIMNEITQHWANPSVTVEQLQTAHDINNMLNNTPQSGKSVLPVLVNYLNALQSSVSLINAATMNRGYLGQALAAVQRPTLVNGAIETSDGVLRPAYQIVTPVDVIIHGLNSTDETRTVSMKMTVARDSNNRYALRMEDGTTELRSRNEFLSIETAEEDDLFQRLFTTGATNIDVDVTFHGVTDVQFGPMYFTKSPVSNWYWVKPIQDALLNRDEDISGFKFSPNPHIDFTSRGPFGYLTGVVISKKISLVIHCATSDYKTLAKNIKEQNTTQLNFLGAQMKYASNTGQRHQAIVSTNDKQSSLTIQYEPTPQSNIDTFESTAFVLGVQTIYPVSA